MAIIHVASYKEILQWIKQEYGNARFTGMGTVTLGKVWPQKVALQKIDPTFDFTLKHENLTHSI